MATMEDLYGVLDSIDETAKEQRDLLNSFIKRQERQDKFGGAGRTTTGEDYAGTTGGAREGTTIRGGVSRGIETGIGGMFMGIAGGISILSKAAGAAAGLGAIGLGVAGFLTALGGADEAIGKLGDGSNLKTLLGNVGEGLSSLDTQSMAALGGLLGTSVLWSTFTGVNGLVKAPVGMAAIGLGLGGFMTGMVAAGDYTGFDGTTFAAQSKNLVAGINEFSTLSKESLTGLALIAGVPALIATANPVMGLKTAVGMSLAGAGIGGFMTGIAAAGDLTGFDGATFAAQAGNVATGLKALEGLNDNTLTALTALAAAGGIAGASGPVGLLSAGLAATGMGLAGFGLGAFVSGIAAAGDLAGFVGVDGAGLKNTMENLAGGLKSFEGVDGTNFANIGTGMAGLGAGLLAFMGAEGIGGITKTARDAFNAVWSFFTGAEIEETGRFDKIAKELEAFSGKDYTGLTQLSTINLAGILNDLAPSLKGFTNISSGLASGVITDFLDLVIEPILDLGKEEDYDFEDIARLSAVLVTFSSALKTFDGIKQVDFAGLFDVEGAAKSIGKMGELINVLTNGGTYETLGESKNARGQTIRGAKITMTVPPISQIGMDAENIKEHLGKVREALGYNFMAPQMSPGAQANLGLLETAISEGRTVVINAPNNSIQSAPTTTVIGGSTTLNSAGGASELDALSVPGGVQ